MWPCLKENLSISSIKPAEDFSQPFSLPLVGSKRFVNTAGPAEAYDVFIIGEAGIAVGVCQKFPVCVETLCLLPFSPLQSRG
eukprot:c34374_g1_i1 orf=42-287(-)